MRLDLSPRPLLLTAAIVLVGATGLRAQSPPSTRRGWLGFSYGATTAVRASPDARPAGRPQEHVLVGEVLKGSPADRAGMEPGDTLVSIDGQPATVSRIAEMSRRIRPGDTVHLQVRRAGRTRALTLKAAERPPYLAGLDLPRRIWIGSREIGVAGDSIRHFMRIYLDSARVALDSLHLPPVRVLRHDSVLVLLGPRGKADTINIGRLERFPGAIHMRILGDSLLGDARDFIELERDRLPVFDVEIAGRRAIAGAALQELNSQLASYFGVREGLLVERVTDDTPAARAGLRAGDVITAAAGRPVGDIADLRRALRGRQGSVKLAIVRKGRHQQLTVRWP